MTFVVVLFSCSLGDPLCTHPDATWSQAQYRSEIEALVSVSTEKRFFREANPNREVVSFEVMSKARWEHLRGSYNCSQIGGWE